ncbi:Uncharacterized protein APZ42_022882 [Daphnia magna]|uniref:Lactosylceramide n=1 Tax=Daphnia magna TaxID=35525 RepID=A0A164VWE4_9CRUS|nr:Uncharacterized protein APZ42_022882 [Daphnia magna]
MRCYLRKSCRRSLLLVVYTFFFYGFLRGLLSPLIFSYSLGSEIVADVRIPKLSRNLPICAHNLLNQSDYHYVTWARKSSNSNHLLSKTKDEYSCRLMSYKIKQAVTCFDIQVEGTAGRDENATVERFPKIHLVFIGDSRIRQQFFYFLRLIPNYDRITNPLEIPRNVVPFHHGDVDVDSRVLGVRISFKWRPIINDTLIEMIHHWAIANHNERPNWILLSMEIYHMLQEYGADHQLYQEKLAQFGPILNKLASASQVIWLNQYPVVELYAKTGTRNTDIHVQKVDQYNKATRRILKNFKNIRIWDSSNALTEEYVRGCLINRERENPDPFFVKNGKNPFINCKPYVNCLDFVHTGYAALSSATQLLYNDICNNLLYQQDDIQ